MIDRVHQQNEARAEGEEGQGGIMKVIRVVTERDGKTTKVPGETSTEIVREEFHYAADSIEQVWESAEWLREDPNRTVIAIIEQIPAITVLPLDAERIDRVREQGKARAAGKERES